MCVPVLTPNSVSLERFPSKLFVNVYIHTHIYVHKYKYMYNYKHTIYVYFSKTNVV